MEETISLKELFGTMRKRLSLILIIAFTAMLVSGVVSYYFLTPIYQASTQMLVNQQKNDQAAYNPGEVQTNLQLINTYNVIIKSPAILEIVIKNLDLDMSVTELNGKITVGSESESQVVTVSVQDSDAERATEIANEIASVFKSEIVKIMNVDNISILAKAELAENQAPIKPQPLLNVAIALVVGLMAGVGLAFLLEYFDNTIKNEQDIEKILGLPVLGVIAIIDGVQMEKMSQRRNERSMRARGE